MRYSKWPGKPKRPYKNLDGFVKALLYFSPKRGIKWPCLKCSGQGWYYDTNDRCPIEGYKGARRLNCNACEATGVGTRKAVREDYKRRIERWKQMLAEWKEQDSLRKSGLKKLTSKERKALGLPCQIR